MRVLIFILLVLGGAAALFYVTQADRSAQHRAGPQLSEHVTGTADQASNEKDEYAKLGADDPAASNAPPEDSAPIFPPPQPRPSQDQVGRAEPIQGSSPNASEVARSRSQLEALRLSFVTTLVRQRNEVRKASVDLATARADLKSALRDRGDLAARVTSLGAETTKLRASERTATDELAAARRSSAEQAAKQVSTAGSDRAQNQNRIASLQDNARAALAKEQETQARLARSETLAGQLRTRLAELDVASQTAASHARDQLAEKDAAASRRDASIAAASQRLGVAETKVRDLTSDRGALIARMTRVSARQRMTTTGLWAARLALASADTRAEAEHRAADLASDRARQLADGNEVLRKRSEAADVQVDEMRNALTRATTVAAAVKAQSQNLGLGKDRANADLANARADNSKLAARLEADGSELQKKLVALRQRNATLAGQAGRLPQLSHDVDEGRKQVGALEETIAALKAQSAEQVARIDVLTRTSESGQASRNAAADRNISGLAEATRKLRLAEANVRDLTAGRDAAIAQSARITAQRRLAANGLSVARVALAAAATRQMALEADSARQGKAAAELIGAKAENAKLTARLDDVAAASETKLADLRSKNAAMAGRLGRLPQLVHDIDEGRTKLSALEKMVTALKSENRGQLAAFDALKRAQKNKEEALPSQAEADRRTKTAGADEKAQKLEAARAPGRAEVARAARDMGSSSDKSDASTTKLGTERKQSASLSDSMAEAECGTSPAGAGRQADECGGGRQDTTSRQAPSTGRSTPPVQADATSGREAVRSNLPDSVFAHVLLRYAHDETRSQVRAQALQATLRTLGVELNDSNAAGTGKPGDSVTYFYAQDRNIADQVARRIEAPAPTRSRGATSKAPRPGPSKSRLAVEAESKAGETNA